MNQNKPHEIPSEVTAEQGVVIVDGPAGTALTFTREAAEETSQRMHDAAVAAADQQDQSGAQQASDGT